MDSTGAGSSPEGSSSPDPKPPATSSETKTSTGASASAGTGAAASGSQEKPPKKAPVRKRTKTGCLTCRKRRIKCDEAKPICNNCTKSKRQCEGYNQRLTFKEPLGSYGHGPTHFGHPVYHQQNRNQPIGAPLTATQAKAAAQQGPLAAIAPKPPQVDFTGTVPMSFAAPQQQQHQTHHPFLAAQAGGPALQTSFYGQLPSPSQSISPVGPPPPPPPGYLPQHAYESTFQLISSTHGYDPNRVIEAGPSNYSDTCTVTVKQHRRILEEDGSQPGANGFVKEGMYWQSDDEASMADSEDDDIPMDVHDTHLKSNDLGIHVARRLEAPADAYGVRMRTVAGLPEMNVLQTYIPSSISSPLNDSQTAAVFWYFVNVTGQSMSLYERHPFDPTPMFHGQPVPKTRQHIWTYTFPIMAFNHPALMQAILALASLQIANLARVPATAAMKHYHLCLRRIARNYQSPSRRTQPATLAATLLLGFYEVWNSDHDKWCRHMWGAHAIMKEIPFLQMTKEIFAHQQERRQAGFVGHPWMDSTAPLGPDLALHEVDTELISQLMGRKVTYDDDAEGASKKRPYTEKDLETYQQLRDLYWWYCKMDVYQSILGGTRLFMPYDQWAQCAPRGECGRMDAIYGTFDHLMLLLGRVANFASRDLARKRKARRAGGPPGSAGRGQGPPGHGPPRQGGPPPPGQGPPPDHGAPPGGGPPRGGPPSSSSSTTSSSAGRGQSPPLFAGLMPTKGTFVPPQGFSPPRDQTPDTDSTDDMDYDSATLAAFREWEEIRSAFELFKSRLGPDFAPMGPELATPEMTPFGPALMYRTYSIAGIWMNYYMGLIALQRAHPGMPPVAMIAAGMSAGQTAPWAYTVARIAAGLHEDTSHVSAVTTLVGAAFIESGFCLFVAGIQFQEPPQRHWLISRLHDMARLTGWQSARQIADGCESGWMKAAEMGRGPPYRRPPELDKIFSSSSTSSLPIWMRPRRIDKKMREQQAGENRLVLARTEQSHFALGLLTVEQDLDRLELSEGE